MTLLGKIAASLVIPLLASVFLLFATLPKRNGEVYLYSKDFNPVHIYRDTQGTTTIQGKSIEEVLYGLGWAHAQDRLWQMYIHKMLFAGRLSELFGDRLIEFDKFMRTLSFMKTAQENVKLLDKSFRKKMKAYCRGVNDYVENMVILPFEFKMTGAKWHEWTEVDSLMMSLGLSFGLATDWQWELAWDRLVELFGVDFVREFFSTAHNRQVYPDAVILNDEDLKQMGLYMEYKGEYEDPKVI